jgi:hypothetical protein
VRFWLNLPQKANNRKRGEEKWHWIRIWIFSKKVRFAKNYYILSFTSKPSEIVNCELKNSIIPIDIICKRFYNSNVTKIEVLYKWRKEKLLTQN